MSALTQTVDTLAVNLHSVRVLQRAGVIDLLAPGRVLRASRSVRQLGPIAGPVRFSAHRDPNRIALIDEVGALTYRELDECSNALARGFAVQGIGEGDTVASMCRDHRGQVFTMLAAAKIGARLVLLNTGFSGPQLIDVLAREGANVVVYDEEFAGTLGDTPSSILRILAWHDSATAGSATVDDLVLSNSSAELPAPQRQGGFVLLTGGTTGTPKGCPREVKSPLAAAAFLERIPLQRNEIVVLGAPLFHGTALTQFMMALSLGSTVWIRRRFDARVTIVSVSEYRASTLVLVPTMLRRILDLGTDVLSQLDLSSLRVIFSAGSALPAALGNSATDVFGDVLYNFYGSTEVGVAAISTPSDWRAAPGTVGKPPRACRARLYDDEGLLVTEPNRKGTIYVGSSLSFAGYSGGGGKQIIDGLLSTGDVGHWDEEGRLFIDGRDDDMIVSGGENVFPGEIEELLYAHSDIAEAAVVAVPDEEFGQRLAAFIVPHNGSQLSADDVRAYVKANLARFKVPRDVHFVDELPRTTTGKLLRRELTP